MEAARRTDGLASLVLYEPPSDVRLRADVTDRAISLIDGGDVDGGLRLQLETAGLSPEEVASITSIPDVWNRFVSTAETIPREVFALSELPWDGSRYRNIEIPTLLLTGELTGAEIYLTADELQEAIPTAQHVVLPGQRHIAFATAPDVFVASVTEFTTQRESV